MGEPMADEGEATSGAHVGNREEGALAYKLARQACAELLPCPPPPLPIFTGTDLKDSSESRCLFDATAWRRRRAADACEWDRAARLADKANRLIPGQRQVFVFIYVRL